MYADNHPIWAISTVFVLGVLEIFRPVGLDGVKASQANALAGPVESAVELFTLSSKVCHGKNTKPMEPESLARVGSTGFIERELT